MLARTLAAGGLAAGLLATLSGCEAGSASVPGIVTLMLEQPAVASPLSGKVIVGYQGWFGCPDDDPGNASWYRWFRQTASPTELMVDLLPSPHDLDPAELCDTGLARPDGSTQKVYSAQNPRVVDAHFRWMREHGIDGAAMQRFVLELDDPLQKQRRDRVLLNVRAAAEANARSFFVLYDISGDGPNRTEAASRLRNDWRYLVEQLGITQSPSYLTDHGKPVLEIWGFGVGDRAGEPAEVAALLEDLKQGRQGLPATYLIGGVPTHWRTLSGDSKSDPAWAAVYRSYDALSPWSVGRFSDEAGADRFVRDNVLPDLAETRRLGIAYVPVTFPGFSWRNQMRNKGQFNLAIANQIPRRCGEFLWHQYVDLLNAGVDAVYAAMFDEFDEGTALAPAATSAEQVPLGSQIVVLDQEGCALPDDWYLRITGKAADYLRTGSAPAARLDDALRP